METTSGLDGAVDLAIHGLLADAPHRAIGEQLCVGATRRLDALLS